MRASLYLLALASLCLLSLAAATFSSTGRPRVYARNHAHPTKAGSATSLSFPLPRNHKKPSAPPAAASTAAPMTLPLHRHHRWESRPVFFADTPNNQPVQGDVWPVAIFWTYINVGTPGVPFPVAIDTGSNDLDIPFYQCDTCIKKEPNQQYNPTQSSTSQPLPCGSAVCPFCSGGQCQFSNTYQTCDLSNPEAPCTISGLFYQDVVSLGPAGPVNATFGVINYQTSNFDQFKNIDGVLGLAGSLDTAEGQNVFQSLVDAKQVPSNVFAMCFYHGSTSNGTITFGGIDPNLYTGEIAYTENTGADSGFYGVNLEAILVDGQTVDGSANSQTILDSGTNVLLVPDTPFQSFKSIFTSNCAQNPLPGICNTTQTLFDGYCYQLSDEQIAKFPTLTLQLSGVKLVMEPLDYLNVETTAGVYCLGIRNTGADGLFIIGDTTMEDYYVIFDREQSRIGWAPVNTKTCGSL